VAVSVAPVAREGLSRARRQDPWAPIILLCHSVAKGPERPSFAKREGAASPRPPDQAYSLTSTTRRKSFRSSTVVRALRSSPTTRRVVQSTTLNRRGPSCWWLDPLRGVRAPDWELARDSGPPAPPSGTISLPCPSSPCGGMNYDAALGTSRLEKPDPFASSLTNSLHAEAPAGSSSLAARSAALPHRPSRGKKTCGYDAK
jgi:hypothetical protein